MSGREFSTRQGKCFKLLCTEETQKAQILTNFYKEFIYVYRVFRAGLYENCVDGVGVVLGVSLHDFSGRQQPQVRNSAARHELSVVPTCAVIHQSHGDKGGHERLVTP